MSCVYLDYVEKDIAIHRSGLGVTAGSCSWRTLPSATAFVFIEDIKVSSR